MSKHRCEAKPMQRPWRKPSKEWKGVRKIADLFGISKQWRTITNHYNGGHTQCEAHEAQQKLSPAEEATFTDFINQSADHGFPQTLHNIENYANLILKGHLSDKCQPVGENWVHRFLDRHHNILQTHWAKPLDTQCAHVMNPEAKKSGLSWWKSLW